MRASASGRGVLLIEEAITPRELRERRQALALSQVALAQALGVTETTVARWERSEQRIGNPERLAAALRLLEARAQPAAKGDRPTENPLTRQRRHNVPIPLGSLTGRDHDLLQIKRLLSAGATRLVTITGTGGIGKTRLALQVAYDLASDFADGAHMVDLAPVADPELVARVAAAMLGIRERANQSLVATVADALAHRHVLLVLDNCEHLLDACAELAHALLTSCENLRVLATSREALSVPAEVTWQLPSLGLAEDHGGTIGPEQVAASPACQLFIERARAGMPSFALTRDNAGAIAAVCRRLDGVPLALELAAARVPLLGVGQVAALLDDRFRILTGGSRAAPRRHQTLRAAIDWSYDQLSLAEQRLFEWLSAFWGGWTREAAEAVTSELVDAYAPTFLDLLTQLVAKSLVVADEQPDGHVRYRMLETMRLYAQEHLARRGDDATVRGLHADYFRAAAEEAAQHLREADQALWLERLESDHDNLRAALNFALEARDVDQAQRLAGALCLFWQRRGYLEEGWNWITRITRLPGADVESSSRAKLLLGAALLAHHRADLKSSLELGEEALRLNRRCGSEVDLIWSVAHVGVLTRKHFDYPRARAVFEEGLLLARRATLKTAEADLLLNLGRLSFLEGDIAEASRLLQRALSISSQMGYSQGKILALKNLGEVAYRRGDFGAARSRLESGIAHTRELKDHWRAAALGGVLGYVLLAEGRAEQARQVWIENLQTWQQLGNIDELASTLEALGSLAQNAGDHRRALRLGGAAASMRRANGLSITPAARVWLDGWLPTARSNLDSSDECAEWSWGEEVSVPELIAYASEIASANEKSRAALTSREREVVVLVTHGLTDREIADDLLMTPHTAHQHIRNVLKKLGLRSRAQIAAWAVEAGVASSRAQPGSNTRSSPPED